MADISYSTETASPNPASARVMDVRPFLFEGDGMVRTVMIDGEPWFVGKDVAELLGYADPTTAIRSRCKGVQKLHPLPSPGGMQEVHILSEPDVLRLIIGSKLPSAERFERWVFEHVLPTIRRTGQYQAPPAVIDEEVQTPDKLKVRKVSTAMKCFGERAGAQLWVKLGLEWVPAMAGVLSQPDLLDSVDPPGTVTVKVTPTGSGAH